MEGGGGRRVLVVGAGLAALGAAQRLQGPGAVRLLEAGSRAGGRIWSRPFASGLAELGAHWIHGPSEGNPVFRLASCWGLLGPGAAEEENQRVEAGGHPLLPCVTYGSSGKVLSPELVSSTRALFAELLGSTQAFLHAKELPAAGVGQYLRAELARLAHTWDENEDSKRLRLAILSTCLKLECCISGTHSMDLVALGSFGEYTSLPGLDCTFPGGYSSLPDRMLAALPEGTVLLNKPVKTIQWQGSFCEKGDVARIFPVRVECEDGDSFLADHVIITVPLGETTDSLPCPSPGTQPLPHTTRGCSCPLLLAGKAEDGQDWPEPLPSLPFPWTTRSFLKEHHQDFFQPPLPKRKAEAIRRLGFGTNNKIFLEFEQPFWEPEQQLLEVVWEDESPLAEPSTDLEASWFKKLIGFVVLQPPEQLGHVLCGFIAGKEAEYMETLSDAEVLHTMTSVLRTLTAAAAPLRRRGHPPHLLLHHARGAAVGLAGGRPTQPAAASRRPAINPPRRSHPSLLY
ncbi:peroxisomal N(1)-acetyl-spermine/spermidine oxidase isoform X2 [Cygnus olor]|uniref:peroxisomal N(1)-acetyl-spermine/spermidine oxidase isoform X2 n=1 Tax=Cygnus olor TaxID=8869 RepID=UPI001ADDF831|nr:peroxisomal N(1)-acetyl-spermine/spermidine oxidase isoform X2 [Cygnus olor]